MAVHQREPLVDQVQRGLQRFVTLRRTGRAGLRWGWRFDQGGPAGGWWGEKVNEPGWRPRIIEGASFCKAAAIIRYILARLVKQSLVIIPSSTAAAASAHHQAGHQPLQDTETR
jgi:hypothetical protein